MMVLTACLVSHLKAYNLLETFHSAYKVLHNRETALVRVSNDIVTALDNKQCVPLVVLLDLSAAFDALGHDILLCTLHNQLGVDGACLA